MDAAPGAPMDGFTASSRIEPEDRVDGAATKPEAVLRFHRRLPSNADRDRSVIRLPSYENVADDPVLYAHARHPSPGVESGQCARAGAAPR